MTTKTDFFTDLRTRIQVYAETTTAVYQPLSDDQLNWQQSPKDWSILQCIDHLNLTHEYYCSKITAALEQPKMANPEADGYKASFMGWIYMFFSLNPKFSFPAPEEITPKTAVSRQALATYLNKQTELLQILDQCAAVDLRHTPIPIAKGTNFNLGDALKIVVYHDDLHFGQANKVLSDMTSAK